MGFTKIIVQAGDLRKCHDMRNCDFEKMLGQAELCESRKCLRVRNCARVRNFEKMAAAVESNWGRAQILEVNWDAAHHPPPSQELPLGPGLGPFGPWPRA